VHSAALSSGTGHRGPPAWRELRCLRRVPIPTQPNRPAKNALLVSNLNFLAWRNWQTRMLEVHVPVKVWKFKSSRPHRNDR
jgi:hypothetical protein